MRHAQRGLTLMELLIVMVVIGILAGIAWPSYRAQVVRTTRAEARVALEQARQGLERCFTRFNAYDAGGCEMTFPANTPSGNYRVTVVRDAATFTLTATPLGAQAADDPQCATLTLNDRGVRGSTGTGNAQQCWGR
jgi:type IV pilus assembly protein PilE